MKKINTNLLAEETWSSPKGKFAGAGKEVSEALGRKPQSTDLQERHPFDVEIVRIAPGKTPYPYHLHSAQWEFYHVISGTGIVRHKDGKTSIEPGDAFLFKPSDTTYYSQGGDNGTPLQKDEPQATNPPNGVAVDYYLKTAPTVPVTMQILGTGDEVLHTFSTEAIPDANPGGRGGRGGRGGGIPNVSALWRPTPEPFNRIWFVSDRLCAKTLLKVIPVPSLGKRVKPVLPS